MNRRSEDVATGTHGQFVDVAGRVYAPTARSAPTKSVRPNYRLYLPKDWASDPARRTKAGVPEAITFRTKPSIALNQIRKAVDDGIPQGVVLADASYGADMTFQAGLLELGRDDIVGSQPNSSIWTDGKAPLPVKSWSGQGRPPKRLQRSEGHQPVLAKNLALSLPASA